MTIRSAFLIALLIASPALATPSAVALDPTRLDPQYPEMKIWAAAGVVFSELPSSEPLEVHLKPGDDLAAAVAVADRTVVLAPGIYPIAQTLLIANRVILRGAGFGKTRLQIMMRDSQSTSTDGTACPVGILLENAEGSGLEKLTITMDESLPPPPDPHDGPYAYDNNPKGQDDLHLTLVKIEGSKNCWIKDCQLINAGSHPLILNNSRHLTIEDTEIRGTYNKSEDSGTLIISGSESCLLIGLEVRDINHVIVCESATGNRSRNNVFIHSAFNVDVRFLDGDTGFNLLENCSIAVPAWHHSPPIIHLNTSGQIQNSNLLYMCTITRDFPVGNRRFGVADNPNLVYRLVSSDIEKTLVEVAGPSPVGNTLWPVHHQ